MTGPPPAAGDFEARVRSLSRELTTHAGHGAEAADALLGMDDVALAGGDPATVRALLDGAGALSEAGDLQRAGTLLVKGINALAANPRATQADLIIPANNLLYVLDRLGDVAQREQVAAFLTALAQTTEDPLTHNAMMVFLRLGQIYHDRGSTETALTMYRQVHRYMTTGEPEDPGTLYRWLVHYARALRDGARYDQVIEVCRLALSVHERLPDAEQADTIQVTVVMAQAAEAGGDRPAARAALEEAVRIAEDKPPADPVNLAAAGAAFHNLALMYAELGEQYERAEALLQAALEIVLRSGRAGSAEHAGELGHLGAVANRRGDLRAAEQRYLEAIEVYERAPDTRPADYADFLTDLAMLRLNDGRASEAVAPFRRAAELRSNAADEGTDRRADALSNLATAHFEAGELDAANREFEQAVHLRLQDG